MPMTIADAALLEELPSSCGILLQGDSGLVELRLAPKRDVELKPIHWLQLLASCGDPEQSEHPQRELSEHGEVIKQCLGRHDGHDSQSECGSSKRARQLGADSTQPEIGHYAADHARHARQHPSQK